MRASTCSPASVAELGNGVLPPVYACCWRHLPCRGRLLCSAWESSRAARNKVRWFAVGIGRTMADLRPVRHGELFCRHDLSCEHGAGVQPTVPKDLLPSSKSRTKISIRHGVAQHQKFWYTAIPDTARFCTPHESVSTPTVVLRWDILQPLQRSWALSQEPACKERNRKGLNVVASDALAAEVSEACGSEESELVQKTTPGPCE